MNQDWIEFVKAAVRRPLEVSTIFPTRPALAQRLIGTVDFDQAEKIVELGCGTGAITRFIQPQLRESAQYLGIEINPDMVNFLKKTYPQLSFATGRAEEIVHLLDGQKADFVVSSLPWTVFSDQMREDTLTAIHQALGPTGVFATYVCANALLYPQARHFLSALHQHFAKVERLPLEWRNIPPAYVYRCQKSV